MRKEDTSITHKDKNSTRSIRKAAFDQRKRDYLRSTQIRPAVFVEHPNKNDTDKPSR